MPITCVIVEDHPHLRRLLSDWLESIFPQVEFIGLESGEDALDFVFAHPTALILMDVHLPGINGIEATRRIKTDHPDIYIVILTMHADIAYRQDALDAGADAFVSKNKTQTDLAPILTDFFTTVASGIGDEKRR